MGLFDAPVEKGSLLNVFPCPILVSVPLTLISIGLLWMVPNLVPPV